MWPFTGGTGDNHVIIVYMLCVYCNTMTVVKGVKGGIQRSVLTNISSYAHCSMVEIRTDGKNRYAQ